MKLSALPLSSTIVEPLVWVTVKEALSSSAIVTVVCCVPFSATLLAPETLLMSTTIASPSSSSWSVIAVNVAVPEVLPAEMVIVLLEIE